MLIYQQCNEAGGTCNTHSKGNTLHCVSPTAAAGDHIRKVVSNGLSSGRGERLAAVKCCCGNNGFRSHNKDLPFCLTAYKSWSVNVQELPLVVTSDVDKREDDTMNRYTVSSCNEHDLNFAASTRLIRTQQLDCGTLLPIMYSWYTMHTRTTYESNFIHVEFIYTLYMVSS